MVYILGAGGHAKTVIALLEQLGQPIAGAFDDNADRVGHAVLGVPVLGPIADFERHRSAPAFVAVGDNAARKAIAQRFAGTPWQTIVSPHAHVHSSARIGPGSIVFDVAVVQPDVRIGEHVIVNIAAGVGHDCIVGNYAHVGPHAALAGNVTVDEGAFLCINSSARPNVHVGEWSTVGAGSVALRSIPTRSTAIGVPARLVPPSQS